MRLVLFDRLTPQRRNFYPLALSRPIWTLRCGMTSLGEKLAASAGTADVACWAPPYMAAVCRRETAWPVNDPQSLVGDDLLLAAANVKASEIWAYREGPSCVAVDASGAVVAARITRQDLGTLPADSLDALLTAAQQRFPTDDDGPLATWNYTWELVLANGPQLAADFRALGRSGIEGTVEQPCAIRGSRNDIFIGRGAKIHPMAVLDAEQGPIYIDEEAEIQPFTRIEGPCYIGRKSILLGAKCRQGNSIGPVCRIGGEVEGTIIQGYSNKYHDGFLGHAYVGQWVNLGALTTNSDLKNDYSEVKITLDGRKQLPTGSSKVGALIGDHAKTSIGTLLNTGACIGAMALLVSSGTLLPKFIPSFTWYLNDVVSHGTGKEPLYATARTALSRRGCQWTEDDEALWNTVYEMTRDEREEAVEKQRKK